MRDKSDGFVFFLVFFEFFKFLTTSSKIFEKTKKQKKHILGDYMRPNISLKSLILLFFEFFLVFSSFLVIN